MSTCWHRLRQRMLWKPSAIPGCTISAWQINLALGQKGKFWQQEPFDHLVRSPEQYEFLRKYIRDNGTKARLPPNEYVYREYLG